MEFLDYVYVNHIYDNPGYFTCDIVVSNDPCLTDQQCELENKCPESDGERTGIYVHESNRFFPTLLCKSRTIRFDYLHIFL